MRIPPYLEPVRSLRLSYLPLGKEEARAEHARLRNGEETLRVLKECTFCYNCNEYCPHGLNPLALIMERIDTCPVA